MKIRNVFKPKKLDNSGYGNHGANTIKKSLIGWMSYSGSPKEDIDDNLETLRERSRDLYMGGAPIASGAIKTIRTNVVGGGLKLKARLDTDVLKLTDDEAEEKERQIEKEFALWSESKLCDAERKNNFYELQQLAILSQLLSGDAFVLLPAIQKHRFPYQLSVQLIESDRVRTPNSKTNDKNIVSGIEFGKYGEPIAYYICRKHPGSMSSMFGEEYDRIPAYGRKTGLANVIHIMESERPGQTRGVPVLASVIEPLKQLGRYTDAELMAAVISGMYTIFIEMEQENYQEPMLGESIPEYQRIDDGDPNTIEIGNGAVVQLGPGEKAKEANPGRPNTAFDGFVSSICKQMGASLEIPYDLLMKQFDSSYSASRAALLEAWKMFKMRREWLISDFCQPIYEQWLTEAVAKGRIDAPGFFDDPIIHKAYCGSEWSGPTQGQLDPLKEVNAAARRVEEGFSTRSRETTELTGGDYYQNMRQSKKEERLRGGGEDENN